MRISDQLDALAHRKVADMKRLADFICRYVNLDLSRYIIGQAFDLDLPEHMLEDTRIAFYAYRLTGRCNMDRYSDLFSEGDLKEIRMEKLPLDRVDLEVLQQRQFSVPITEVQIDHHLLACHRID